MVKSSTVIGIAIVGVVGILVYFMLGKSGGSVSPSLSTPQMATQAIYPSASSAASGAGSLSVSEVYNYSPSTISESTHTYQTTNTANVKAGLFNF